MESTHLQAATSAGLMPAVDGAEKRPATALVIDDSEALCKRSKELLEATGLFGQVITAADGFAAFEHLRRPDLDVVLCDLDMPRCDGIKFLRLKAMRPELQHIPVLVLTATDDVDNKVAALEAGACDYVTKGAHPAELRARISVHLKVKQLHDQLREHMSLLERLSNTDALTQLANRRRFSETLEQELARARRYKRPLSLVMLDVDHFKRLNDSYGHQAGDDVLKSIAGLLPTTLRAQDMVARFGGEEFAIVLPETPVQQARAVAERLRSAIESRTFRCQGHDIGVTASFGVADTRAGELGSPQQLIGAADRALYTAKTCGRNRVAS